MEVTRYPFTVTKLGIVRPPAGWEIRVSDSDMSWWTREYLQAEPGDIVEAREIVARPRCEPSWERVYRLLGELEWTGTHYDNSVCPLCGGPAAWHRDPKGHHEKDCELVAIRKDIKAAFPTIDEVNDE